MATESRSFRHFPGVVQKVGLAEGVKWLVSRIGFGDERRPKDYRLLTARHGLPHAGQLPPPRCLTLPFCRGSTPVLLLQPKKRLAFDSGAEARQRTFSEPERSSNPDKLGECEVLDSGVEGRFTGTIWQRWSEGVFSLVARMPVDFATAHARNRIASEAHTRKGEAKRRGRPYGRKFMWRRRAWRRREASAGYIKRFTAARASAICGSLAVEFSKWPRNSW